MVKTFDSNEVVKVAILRRLVAETQVNSLKIIKFVAKQFL
jgi:hypothetical protein